MFLPQCLNYHQSFWSREELLRYIPDLILPSTTQKVTHMQCCLMACLNHTISSNNQPHFRLFHWHDMWSDSAKMTKGHAIAFSACPPLPAGKLFSVACLPTKFSYRKWNPIIFRVPESCFGRFQSYLARGSTCDCFSVAVFAERKLWSACLERERETRGRFYARTRPK